MKTAVILGAGFSRNSGIPIQAEIPKMLVAYGKDDGFEIAVGQLLKEFIMDIFGYDGGENYPNLDDIFTCIDISTNSGHHLGMKYSPLDLRAVRRFLVYRVFSILENSFRQDSDVRMLLEVLIQREFETQFVVLNWDNVLEKYLLSQNCDLIIDYCNGGELWYGNYINAGCESVKLLKLHGSSNWLYCDNCRVIFNDSLGQIDLKEKAGFLERDMKLLYRFSSGRVEESSLFSVYCKRCGNKVSSHIATFSYRKSFRSNSFTTIWNEAEKALTDADRWIFIGYSLPDADYEFKHLLKIAELKLEHVKKDKLKIDVVLLNSDKTIHKYKSFFGRKISYICNNGVKEYLDFFRKDLREY